MTRITETELRSALARLKNSDRGHNVIVATLQMLDNGGIGLDQRGIEALMTLLGAAFTTHPGTTRDLMREAVLK